jgi:hypothetical protein
MLLLALVGQPTEAAVEGNLSNANMRKELN